MGNFRIKSQRNPFGLRKIDGFLPEVNRGLYPKDSYSNKIS